MSPIIDFVGYEVLLNYIREHRLYLLHGDIIEIGAFVGGGTAKLADFALSYNKKVFVIDIFDPLIDRSSTCSGVKMSDIYLAFLEGKSQYHIYCENTGKYGNIVTIREDSRKVKLSLEQQFMFGFIDGNHQPEYVRNDFSLVWELLVSKGVVALHDYKTELPEVTRAIDELLDEKQNEISDVAEIVDKHIILIKKN